MQPHDDYRFQWRSSPGLIPAIVIIGVGVIFLLNNLHVLRAEEWYRYWPTILIAAGLAKLVDSNTQGGRLAGGVLIGVGGLFLLDTFNLIQLTWDAFWPLVLIGVGLLMLFNRLSGPRQAFSAVPPYSADSNAR